MNAEAFRLVAAGGLPIFRRDDPGRSLFYAPGFLVVASPVATGALADELMASEPPPGPAADLRRYAAGAQQALSRSATGPFQPVCLTLYLHNECNLRCAYCFADATPAPARASILPPSAPRPISSPGIAGRAGSP